MTAADDPNFSCHQRIDFIGKLHFVCPVTENERRFAHRPFFGFRPVPL